MRKSVRLCGAAVAIALLWGAPAGFGGSGQEHTKAVRCIVTSDTILSGMVASILPPEGYSTEALLPPGQCPGHYDVKFTDIEKIRNAGLNVSFRAMGFMKKAGTGAGPQLLVDGGGRNWMAPESHILGLIVLANELSRRFPDDGDEMMRRKEAAIRQVQTAARSLLGRIRAAGISGKPILASSMQKEPLEWMGLRVVGEYGRQESLSARQLVNLLEIGKDQKIVMVVDNLQSGPEVGKGMAESLGVPHVVLTNFPSENGYLATLERNVDAVLEAAGKR